MCLDRGEGIIVHPLLLIFPFGKLEMHYLTDLYCICRHIYVCICMSETVVCSLKHIPLPDQWWEINSMKILDCLLGEIGWRQVSNLLGHITSISHIIEPWVHVCYVTSVVSDSLWPHGLSPPGSSVHGILQPRILEWVVMPSSRDLPDPGIEPVSLRSPALAAEFFTTSATWQALVYLEFPADKSWALCLMGLFGFGSSVYHIWEHCSNSLLMTRKAASFDWGQKPEAKSNFCKRISLL